MFPHATGTLVTAVGFLPVGIARPTAGEYAGNIFWIVGLALVMSWIVAVSTPYIGVKLLPDFTKHGSAHGRTTSTTPASIARFAASSVGPCASVGWSSC